MKKLPARFAGLVMPLLLSILMTCVVSATSTAVALGIDDQFVPHWLHAWGISWLIAFPALLLALPLARRLTALVVESP